MKVVLSRAGLATERGGIAIQVAILLVVLIGFVALGTEVVAMLMTKRQMQSASDSAALAAATAINRGYPVAYGDEATAIARAAGFVNGIGGTTIAINRPPTSGPYAGNASAVEVIMTQAQSLVLIPVISNAAFTLHVRSVALPDSAGVACALALSTSAPKSISAQGGVSVSMNSCGVASNSTAGNSIFVGGGSSISAAALTTVGGYDTQGSGQLNISGTKTTAGDPTPDPYADRTVPTPGACLPVPDLNSQTVILPSGTYCSDLNIVKSNVTLNGTYILVDADFIVNNHSLVTGTDTTIVLTGTGSGSKIGSVSVNVNSQVNMTAPTTGATAGMVFFQDPRAPSSGTNSITANADTTFTGALYFPSQALAYQAGTTSTSPCTQLIANTISFQGGATLNSGCTGVGITPIGGGAPKLVE